MDGHDPLAFVDKAPSPAYVVDVERLKANLAVLDSVQQRTGAKILLALKGFAMHALFPLIRETLHGVCASSPHEARLGRELFGREVHSFAPAFSATDIDELVQLSDHIVFNSFAQWERHRERVLASPRHISCGLRINPEHSEGAVAIYDPCARGSRLGIRRADFDGRSLDGIDGLHWHTLCEQNSDALERTLDVVERKFGSLMHGMQWINFGGGHHITRPDYDIDRLCRCIDRVTTRYKVQVYLEPGEAVALHTGFLVASVLDVVEAPGEIPVAILDTSASAHMPDVLEMPYRPGIIGADLPGVRPHTYRLGGLTCLAGDVIGDYSFDAPLTPGARIVFTDMAHYTMVKNTTFNGILLPSICSWNPVSGDLITHRKFGYPDYRDRLS